jgi:hypothetical protein
VENDSKRKEQNYVIAIIMIILKQQMENTCLVTELKKKHYGTDVQVVEFGCMKSAGDVLLLMVSCVTYALGCCNLSKNGPLQ